MTAHVYELAVRLGSEAQVGVALAKTARALAEVEGDTDTFTWDTYNEQLLEFLRPSIALTAFGSPSAPRLIVNALADLAWSSSDDAGWNDPAAIRGALLSRLVYGLTAVALAYDRIDLLVEFKRLRWGRPVLLDESLCFGPTGTVRGEGRLYGTHLSWFKSLGLTEPGLLSDRKRRASWLAEADLLLATVRSRGAGDRGGTSSAVADRDLFPEAHQRLAARFIETRQRRELSELFDCTIEELGDVASAAFGNLAGARADGLPGQAAPPLFS